MNLKKTKNRINQKMVNINQKMVNLLSDINLIENISIRSLSKRADEPYTSMNRTVKKLQELGIVKLAKKGNSIYVSLNLDFENARYFLALANNHKSNHLVLKNPLIKKIQERFVYNCPLVLFGSYASGKERKGSDYDLSVIGASRKIETEYKQALRQIELIHKIEINALFFTKKEFIEMLMAKTHNVGKEILLNHVVLKNADIWFNLISEVHDVIRI